jgi:hypothetical protein
MQILKGLGAVMDVNADSKGLRGMIDVNAHLKGVRKRLKVESLEMRVRAGAPEVSQGGG